MKLELHCYIETYQNIRDQNNKAWHYQIVSGSTVLDNSIGTKTGGYQTEEEAIEAGKAGVKKRIDYLLMLMDRKPN